MVLCMRYVECSITVIRPQTGMLYYGSSIFQNQKRSNFFPISLFFKLFYAVANIHEIVLELF